jgi:hypothetical protein
MRPSKTGGPMVYFMAPRVHAPPFVESDCGFIVAAIHRGAIAESRKVKPEISLVGVGERPIEDEIEFELLL